jgi:hypothetical protein
MVPAKIKIRNTLPFREELGSHLTAPMIVSSDDLIAFFSEVPIKKI